MQRQREGGSGEWLDTCRRSSWQSADVASHITTSSAIYYVEGSHCILEVQIWQAVHSQYHP